MKKEVKQTVTQSKIYCDMCGKETPTSYTLSVVVYKGFEQAAEYGLGFTHTGDWCESCRDRLDYLVEQALNKVLVERYSIDHSKKNGTIDFYKKVLEN